MCIRDRQQTAPREDREGCYDQTFFQIHDFEKPCQVPVWWKEPLGNGERFGEKGEKDPLIAAQDGEASEQQRVSIERAMPDPQARHGDQITKQTKGDKGAAGDQKQPARTTHQKITKCLSLIHISEPTRLLSI